MYFYDIDSWNKDEPYEAFSPNMEIVKNLDFLDNYSGNIWIIDGDDDRLYNILNKYELIKNKDFRTKYHQMSINIHLIRK